MGEYLAMRIINRAYTYAYVINARPDLKESIDQALTERGREDLITS